jgi:hypothetical protein
MLALTKLLTIISRVFVPNHTSDYDFLCSIFNVEAPLKQERGKIIVRSWRMPPLGHILKDGPCQIVLIQNN